MGQKQEYYFRFTFSAQKNPRSLPYRTPEISTIFKKNSYKTFMEQTRGSEQNFQRKHSSETRPKFPSDQHLTQQDGKVSQISQHSLKTLTHRPKETTPRYKILLLSPHLASDESKYLSKKIYLIISDPFRIPQLPDIPQIRSLVPIFTNIRVRHSIMILEFPFPHFNSSPPQQLLSSGKSITIADKNTYCTLELLMISKIFSIPRAVFERCPGKNEYRKIHAVRFGGHYYDHNNKRNTYLHQVAIKNEGKLGCSCSPTYETNKCRQSQGNCLRTENKLGEDVVFLNVKKFKNYFFYSFFFFSFSIFFPISYTTGQKSQHLMEETDPTAHFKPWSPWTATSQTIWIRSYTPPLATNSTNHQSTTHTNAV
ncbi:hypothetical protein VP01_2166g2 [Puccinia sorghi]|uniref:Uncharacterized protein n=1 Tax=Puccinia sorghi TaxID=27349 RepID=A0A0L6VBC5_9BASI|nr:hypothetical protein VP01_2166g2 [Puccinia sorghi]